MSYPSFQKTESTLNGQVSLIAGSLPLWALGWSCVQQGLGEFGWKCREGSRLSAQESCA